MRAIVHAMLRVAGNGGRQGRFSVNAFISRGRLYIAGEDGQVREVESPFCLKHEAEELRRDSTNPWKERGAADFYFGKRPGVHARYMFREMARGDGQSLFYVLNSGDVSGLFAFDPATGEERRLFHRNGFDIEGLDYDGQSKRFVVGRRRQDQAVDIELLDSDGRTERVLTGGDSLDSHPSFSRRDPDRVLFQSRGIARNDEGMFVTAGPSGIMRIGISSGALEELIEDREHDYLLPQEDSDGVVYCIRRPIASAKGISFWRHVLGVLGFPVFFAVALLNFLKVFTQAFQNRVTLADGPPPPDPREGRHLRVLDQVIELSKSRKGEGEDERTLVPKTWQLVRIAPGREPEVLADGICSFDLDDNGGVVCSNGYRMLAVAQGERKTIARHELIEKVRC